MSSPLPGDRPSDGCGQLAGLPGCFFGEPPAAPFLLPYPVLTTHDTGFRPAASAGSVVTRGFRTCDSPPVVLGASPSSPTTPEFVRAPGQRPATPGYARSVPVSWPLARLRLDSRLHTACRLVGTGHQRSGVVAQAGGQLGIRTLPAAPLSRLLALQVPGNILTSFLILLDPNRCRKAIRTDSNRDLSCGQLTFSWTIFPWILAESSQRVDCPSQIVVLTRQTRFQRNDSHNVKIVDSSAILKLHSDHTIALASSSSSSTMSTGCYTIKSASSKPSYRIDFGDSPLFLPGSDHVARREVHAPHHGVQEICAQDTRDKQLLHHHNQVQLNDPQPKVAIFRQSPSCIGLAAPRNFWHEVALSHTRLEITETTALPYSIPTCTFSNVDDSIRISDVHILPFFRSPITEHAGSSTSSLAKCLVTLVEDLGHHHFRWSEGRHVYFPLPKVPQCLPEPNSVAGLLILFAGTSFTTSGELLAHLVRWNPPLPKSLVASLAILFASEMLSQLTTRSSTYILGRMSLCASVYSVDAFPSASGSSALPGKGLILPRFFPQEPADISVRFVKSHLHVHFLDVCLQVNPVPPEANQDPQQIRLMLRSRIQQVVQGDVPEPRRPVEDNSALYFARATHLIHGMMRQDGHCDRQNGSESTPIEKDEKTVEALKEVQVGLMKTENHSRTLLKTAKTWLIEVTFK
ncbi:hypothetical protein Tsp_04637 [Trichinella spiralis]|uniref:hypothetical protein n=1 Tax=Trichinella spiralis TaxID=6334 RepID=UPI0001EFD5A0|nr:hypothetical protein Tsp_04637 [Trichinella spiralis]